MKLFILLFSTLWLAIAGAVPVSACALGFSFHFEPLPAHFGGEANSLKGFLDKTYAKRGWEWARQSSKLQRSLQIKTAERPENSARIGLSVGSRSPDLLGVYKGFSVFKMSLVTVIEFAGEKEVAKRLPSKVDIEKLQNFGPYSGRTSKVEAGIEKIADFKLSELAMPFAKLRFRSMDASGISLFASFVPTNERAPVQIIRAPKELNTSLSNPCKSLLYVYGKWPQNLRKSYSYE